jgi:iron(III) transport system permease protein
MGVEARREGGTLPLDRSAGRVGLLDRVDAVSVVTWVTIALVGYLVLAPLAMLFYGSLTDARPGEVTGLTLKKYVEAYGSSATWRALGNSFIFAAGSSTLAFAFGTYLAWVTQRTNTPWRRAIFLGAMMPVFVPSVLMVVSWILLLSPQIGVINGLFKMALGLQSAPFDVYTMAGMIWVAGVIETPLAFLWMWPALNAMDPSLEEAASVAGANQLQTFWRVVLRLVSPAMLATWLIVFVRQLESFGVPGLLGMPRGVNVLATEIYLTTTRSPRDQNLASAYAVILLVLTLAGIALYRRATSASDQFATITGKGYRPRTIDLGPWRYATLALAMLLLACMIGLPMFALVFNSFLPFLQAPTM